MLILFINIYRTAAAQSRATPASAQGLSVTASDIGAHMPAGHTHHAAPREVQHRARNPRPGRAREQPYEVQIQDLRQAVAHQRNSYNRYYENRYYGGHGNHPGYRSVGGGNSGGSIERDYNHQSSNFMQGLSGTYYPGYGQCRLCGKWENECWLLFIPDPSPFSLIGSFSNEESNGKENVT